MRARTLPALVLLLALGGGTAPARAQAPAGGPAPTPAARAPKVAVLLLKTGAIAEDLADNLTEVLIVKLVSGGGRQVIGKEVVKTQLGGDEAKVLACIGNRICIGNVATALGLHYLIVGTLGQRDGIWIYNLYYIEAASSDEVKRIHREVAGDVAALTRSLDAALAELLTPKVQPGTLRVTSPIAGARVHLDEVFIGTAPVTRPGVAPGQHRVRVDADGYRAVEREVVIAAGRTETLGVGLERIPPRRKTWRFHLAWSTLGVGLSTTVVAGALGGLSRKSTATTQAQALADLRRRKKLALGANVMIGVSAAALLTSMGLFIFARKGFYTGGEHAARIEVAPLPGGAYVSGGFRW